MDYRSGANYSITGDAGGIGYADYRRNFAEGMNRPLVSSADPMKANSGHAALYEEEPGCAWKVCRWCMILTTVAIVVLAVVFGVMFTDCHDMPLVGQKDSCKHSHPAGTGSLSDSDMIVEYGGSTTTHGLRQGVHDGPW